MAHATYPDEWAIDLLIFVRTPEDLQAFIDTYRATFKLDHPTIRELERRMINYEDLHSRRYQNQMEGHT
jgi:hypothetical protein